MKRKLIAAAACLFLILGLSNQLKAQSIDVGDKMPQFSLTDQNGKVFNSKDYVGKSVLVIYFYPKDESIVCTKEACSFRDNFNDFTNAGAKVIGINSGTVESHKEFSDHHKLPFILLSDPDNKVYKQFGVKKFMFMNGRKTFVVAKNGVVTFSYEAMMQGKEHADDALKFIKSQASK
jgi:peroxiredoxin Q/BCP